MRLDDEHIVVTGAGGGIGAVVAEGLSVEGAAISCWDAQGPSNSATAARIVDAGGSAFAATCDLTDYEAASKALAESEAALGPITGLVAVAGGAAGERIPFLEQTLEDWQRMIDRNLTSAFVSGRVVGQVLAERKRGSIVFFGSQSANTITRGMSAYSAAKGAIKQLSRAMAVELAPYGVRVNAVSPGVTITAANVALVSAGAAESHLVDSIPLGRAGRPSEMVGAIVYLLSTESSFTTGAWIDIDGGFTLV
jgi:NAD(P)-dependent dehydrogenase (short-subunit alcohol dehydrogenase family)